MCNISTHRLDCQCRLLPRPKKTSRSGDDVSRLLDPLYSPSASSHSSSSSQTKVYIDPEGELHDPDYRHFPNVGGRKVPEALDDQILADARFLAPMASSPPFSAPLYPEHGNATATSKLKKSQQLRRTHTSSCSSESSRMAAAASFTDYLGDGDDDSEFSDKETDTSYSVSDKGDETHHQPCTKCRETMMKEWHSLSLSWNIGVYRMKKRLRRAFSAEEISFGQTPTEPSGSCRFCLFKKYCESRQSARKSSPNSEKILESVS